MFSLPYVYFFNGAVHCIKLRLLLQGLLPDKLVISMDLPFALVSRSWQLG